MYFLKNPVLFKRKKIKTKWNLFHECYVSLKYENQLLWNFKTKRYKEN